MGHIETDYLVIGAGASGMAFVDELLARSNDDIVLVDRRHRPGGHWLDAYPFVRLHQPSAYYGVGSRTLGSDRIDNSGPNAGFYERSSAAEICDYFGRVLDEHLLPSGRVRFLGMTDYRGHDSAGHHLVSLLTGAETTVTVRKKLVDATYIQSDIPSRHRAQFEIDAGVTMIPPNDLVDLHQPAAGFTVIGAGKTGMDTCCWLLDSGVDPERIRWVRPRDSWLFERTFMQPLELVAHYMQLQAHWVEAAAEAQSGDDFAHRLAESGVFVRIDPAVEPSMFLGATISEAELRSLRTIRRVIPKRRVRRLEARRIVFDRGEELSESGEVYVDCTARGVQPASARPVFEPGRITLQWVTIGIAPWSAATVAAIEAVKDGDQVKNALCPVLVWTGNTVDLLGLAYAGMTGFVARAEDPALTTWNDNFRLNPARGALEQLDDKRVVDALASLMTNTGPALRNMARRGAGAAARA